MTGKSILTALLFSFVTFTQLFAQCDCVTSGNCPVPIQDYGVYSGYLDVTVNGANDLGVNPLTSVCVTITHTWIGDLSISLTSPSGVEYLIMADAGNNYFECGNQQNNAEICIVPGTSKPLTNNTDYICNQGPCSVGTCCLRGNWTVPCGGVTSPVTGWPQAPNCDLNDFNVPGDPANGTWTISILDVCNLDVGMLENFSLTFLNGQACYACEADGGTLDTIEIIGCIGDSSLILDLPPNYGMNGPLYGADSALYDYVWVLVQNNIILSLLQNPDLSTQPPGNYEVYGLSYLSIHANQLPSIIGMNVDSVDADLASSTAPFCADLSENFIPVTVLPAIPPTVLNTTLCAGECVIVGGQSVCTSSAITLSSWLGCDSVIQVNLTTIQPDTVDYTATVCAGNCVSIGGQQYCPPTEYYVQLQNWQGCDSIVHLAFNELSPTAIITPANPPPITCTVSAVALSASTSGPGVLTYAWSGPGTFTSTQSAISATTPGTYTVTVSDNSVSPACTSTASVTVADGRVSPDLVLNGPPPSICLGQSFDLVNVAIQDVNNTGAALTVHSGTPATLGNQLSNTVVSPITNTTYYYKATKGSCSDEIAVTLIVKPVPTANFTATALSCLNGSVTVTYTGNAGAGATYNWVFDGGTATPGTGSGPHTVTFPFAGPKAITMTVTENGCTSAVFIQNITVENPLAQPVINCQTTTSSVLFSWASVPGSTGYNATSSVPGTQVSPTSYEVTGLTPGQSVTLTVEAIGAGACGNSTATQTCTAQNCPPVTVSPTPVADICLDAATAPFDLQASVTGSTGGTLTWSGTGIVDASAGTFDPSQAAVGANTITATYSKNGCSASNTLTINVFQTPTASLAASSNICAGTAATVTFTGSAGAGLTYAWDFDGGTATPGSGSGPQSVVWSTPGAHTVSVTVADGNGCTASPATASVQVDAPLAQPTINCSATSESITFSWPAVPGATSYDVNVTSGQAFTQNSATSYTVSGLTPGEVVSIQVTAVSGNACPNSMAITDCTAIPCPVVSLTIDPVADICRKATTQPVQLVANVTGGSPSGSLEWSGPGVSIGGLFDPNQANVGANTITAIYTDGPCNTTVDIIINVFQTPDGGFSYPASACQGIAVVVNYNGPLLPGMTYNWDFGGATAVPGTGPGPHNVTWPSGGLKFVTLTVVSPEGCVSSIFTGMVTVNAAMQAPQINCVNTTTSIEFTWPSVPGATGYTVTTSTGQTGTQTTPTTYLVTGLQPLEQVCVTVTAVSGNACPNTSTQLCCNALPCPNLAVGVAPVADFCLGTSSPIQLVATVTGSDGSGTGTWSGQGIVNPATGTFSATAAGFGEHVIVYTFVEDGCTYTGSQTIGVFAQPTADFVMDGQICLTDFTTVTFSGVAGATAVYTWDFDGGTAVPGIGPGPHQVEWNSPGIKNLSLSVTDGSCTSSIFTQQIQVDDEMETPVIICSATTEEVVFSWNPVANATGYSVAVINGSGGSQTSDTSYVFSGLNPLQQVGIQVTVNGNTGCPLPVASMSCNALPCPVFTVAIDPVSPICLTATAATVQLVADVDGVGQSGTGTWSGVGVVDAVLGIFDPVVAGVGNHEITYNYQQVNCSFDDKIILKIVPPPTADAGPDRLLTCWESDQMVHLGGTSTSGSQDISYLWTAASGSFPGDELARNPKVGTPGLFTLTVTNTALGCASSDDVLVMSTQSSPEPEVTVEPTFCGNGGKDAYMTVSTVTGGMDPYLYSLNGEPFVTGNEFPFLEAGEYELTVIDAEGCTGTANFRVEVAGMLGVDLTTNLVGQALVKFGESIQLTAVVSLPASILDSIAWTNGSLLSCTDCLDPMATPVTQTTFMVTVFKNGCKESDSLTVYVDLGEGQVYVPTAFSPNDDGTNDLFRIYAGSSVKRVKNFFVFDRWGEMVYKYEDFDPKEPSRGWNGKLDGKPMNPAVFVWFAEVEFVDGSMKVLEGEVTLMR
ncbi:MAG: gliding motility-associated C-terminal domain-containing protein [Saprospiraceae bacterium]|nr:gliding motility-associated C-terminal domain-containing protein [Saprospiraceae bacterium]MCF8250096.1 gliding motility-associated C-terminal domain-containing protein [Saprospiraceae bacterium]MCF8279558.1 gliding motility-associated C-terminal domain-containing protein [Bacteroidales bacterium]MCF8311938.1 gliding motility-associated C-terminal domain-containing protein [Saprospiraceae bacterium]MCF8440372.1 gliding motility-associated C-terminal domain-containing protein [Saprospiraceae 